MFNHELYLETAVKMRAEIQASEPSWRATVDARYARFVMRRAGIDLEKLESHLAKPDDGDRKKLLEYAAGVLEATARSCQIAAFLLDGRMRVGDPVESEVLIRTLAEMTKTQPQGEKPDGPAAPVLRVRPPARAPAVGVKAIRRPGGLPRRSPPKKPGTHRRPS